MSRLQAEHCGRLCYGKVDAEHHLAAGDRPQLPVYGHRCLGTESGAGTLHVWTSELIRLPPTDRAPYGRFGFVWQAVPALALPHPPPPPEEAIATFCATLALAAAYADANDLDPFGDCFRKARQELTAPAPPPRSRWLSPHAPEIALRLMAAAQTAYVFGTMGSWNDVPTLGEPDYIEVTTLLSEAIAVATTCAANL